MNYNHRITAGDFLAGGGGITKALSTLHDVKVCWVLNHSQMAIRTNMFNNKGIKHYWVDIRKQDEHVLEPVDFIWASIECTQHSNSNGKRKKKLGSYTLGWELLRYLKVLYPYVIGIEDVPEFKKWAPTDENDEPIKGREGEEFEKWKKTICGLGYDYHENIRNAADDGIPTRRVRYFAFFTRKELGMQVNWPKPSHNESGSGGFKKWLACKNYIDLSNTGESIFGRKLNSKIKKGYRRPLCPNTRKRIAAGCVSCSSDLRFISQYYSAGANVQSINRPLNTITTKDRHILVTCSNMHFISNQYNSNGNPGLNNSSIDEPLPTITTQNKKQLISVELGHQYKADNELKQLANREKAEFLKDYFLPDIELWQIAADINAGNIEFDIKMRFLEPDELARISTFPEKYFTNPLLKLTREDQLRMIGNAVPPEWGKTIIQPIMEELQQILSNQKIAI